MVEIHSNVVKFRFFKYLVEDQRRAIFTELGSLPTGYNEEYDQGIEVMLLRKLFAAGKVDAVANLIIREQERG
jgi:hypothetical protein